MRKKIVIGAIILLSNILLCVACNNTNSPITSSKIDKISIAKAIEQSAMDDGGYRFANAELKSQFSVYATYYIRMAKEYADLPQISISPKTKNEIQKKFLDIHDPNLTDVFCAISLLERDGDLTIEIKEKISSYLNTLYNKDIKCYELYHGDKEDDYLSNIYANYLVYTVGNLLNIEIDPINDWLKKAVQEVFASENIIEENSSAYSMFLELAKKHDLKVPKKSIEAIIKMFESNLDSLDELENSGIYIPVFLMDFLDFSKLANYDSSKNYDKIIFALCDENGIKEDAFMKYDSYGLYATIRALKLAQYNFESCIHFYDVFNEFDSFMLTEDSYISPGFVESNLVDTYYVDALIHKLGIEPAKNISKYCINNKDQIIQSDILNIYYYLKLLQRNDLLEIVEADKMNIIQKLSSNLNILLNDTTAVNTNLPLINGCIKSLVILGESPQISIEQYKNIIENFSQNSNDQLEIYQLTGLIEFINLSPYDSKNKLQQHCEKLERKLIQLSSKETSNKIMLQNMALNVFKESNYTITSELNQMVKKTLMQVQDESGLFKGGDSNEDVVSFRNTYDAITLYESIN